MITVKASPLGLQDLRSDGEDLITQERGRPLTQALRFHEAASSALKGLFDGACEQLHYAGSCHRVGRLMRLAAMENGEWVGGIVLGSPFPNVRVRDDAFGLTPFVTNLASRGLANAWGRENQDYWQRLQLVANQARAFVFPEERGRGIAVRMHRLLETQGRRLWEARYGRLVGFDTLCTERNSKLFSDNGWVRVGRTKGYSRDPSRRLSRRVASGERARVESGELVRLRDNAGLTGGGYRWWVWVRILGSVEENHDGA